MCGIAVMCGMAGRHADEAALDRMTRSLVHRGPDDGGLFLDASVGLGFRRLAILDLSPAGHQPMVSDDGRFVLVFNGEIFNYVELRRELVDLGYRFRSTGDSEVLLNAYRQWGAECLPKLNGMWAFIIYDKANRRLFGSRDRFGVKPLFVHRQREYVLLASEIKAIRASGLYRGGVNWTIASRFLIEGHLDDRGESFYDGIDPIPPGSAFELDLEGRWKSWTYWDLDHLPSVDVHDPPAAFADLFEQAVRLRMRSDVPVGVCLSGGLDSTSIICAAARQRNESNQSASGPLQAFCYMAKEFDESKYIADTLAETNAQLRELETDPMDLWQNVRRMLWYQDEPVHTMTATVGYRLMGLVAGHGIRVVLNGQGADETIGGYFSFFLDYWRELLGKGRVNKAWAEIRAYAEVHGESPLHSLKSASMSLLMTALHGVPLYRALSDRRHGRKVRSHPWFTKDLSSHVPSGERQSGVNRLNGVLKRAVTEFPLPLYLRIEDRNSMAHSVETRLPFLDYRLVSLLFGLPSEWKVRGPWNKFILREAMRGRIPESVRARPDKMGFPTAGRKWFAHDLYEPMADLLASRAVRERGIYHVGTVAKDLERHKQGEIDVHHDLFHLAEFEMIADLMREQVVRPDDGPVAIQTRGADGGHPQAAVPA
ncbi:MAG TPA: asparagine synthase (glutamine-hydrolyzing) [Nitrospiraceae bacterium]|nr:asparagine synthase (glutamine-hydrolyzing) [Nitrospiraceae bacterium]